MTNGYGFKGFASGLQSGLGLGLERQRIKSLADERKALEKAKKEEELAMNTWLMDNRENIEGYSNLPQEKRNWLIASSFQYSDKMAGFFNDWDKAIKNNDTEEIKTKQKQWEDILATKKDLALSGVSLADGFFVDGSEYDPNKPLIPQKDTEYIKQVEIGKLAGGETADVMARQTWEQQGFGELPEAPADLSVADKKYNWAIDNYKAGKISFEQLSQFMGTAGGGTQELTAKQQEVELMKQYGATTEEIKNKLLGTTTGAEGTPAPTSTENIRDDILKAPTLNDAKRIQKNYADKYDETALGIPDVDKFWSDERVRRLDSLKQSIENLLVDRGDKGRWLKPGTVTSAEIGMEIEGDEQEAAIAYRDLRIEYMKFRDMLEKMGVDVSQYPKLKPLSEIEKVGGWEGAVGWGVKGIGVGIKKGDYKSIYY